MPFGTSSINDAIRDTQNRVAQTTSQMYPANNTPGKRPRGFFDPRAAAPTSEVAPKQPQAPAQAPSALGYSVRDGFDMSRAGAAEHAYGENSGQLQAPGAAESYAQPGRFDNAFGSTASGQYWNSLQGGNNAPKDMSAYYNRAYDTGANRLNNQFASRGMFTSSAATGGLSDFGAALGAQQAKDEAGYDLQSRQLNDQVMRGAAGSADSAAQGRYGSELTGAAQSDSSLRGRLGLLGEGAASADASRLNRVNGTFDNLTGLATGVAGVTQGAYDDMFDTDQGLFDANQQMGLGSGLQNLNGTAAVGQGRVAGTAATNAAVNQDVNTGMTALKYLYG